MTSHQTRGRLRETLHSVGLVVWSRTFTPSLDQGFNSPKTVHESSPNYGEPLTSFRRPWVFCPATSDTQQTTGFRKAQVASDWSSQLLRPSMLIACSVVAHPKSKAPPAKQDGIVPFFRWYPSWSDREAKRVPTLFGGPPPKRMSS